MLLQGSSMLSTYAAFGFLLLLVFFVGVIVSWWALGALKWEQFVRTPLSSEAMMLRFLLAVVGGIAVSLMGALFFIAVQGARLLG